MSIDDQLFKQDGTYLTKVDIAILRLARHIASFLFSEEDDVTFDRALVRIMKTAAITMALSGVPRGLGGNLFGTVIALALAHLYWKGSGTARCTGVGTLVPSGLKRLYVYGFLFSPSLLLSVILLLNLQQEGWGFTVAADIIYCGAYAIYLLGIFFVMRLQNKPPKRKKARAFKPALAQN